MTRINIATKNKTKLEALKEVIADYNIFSGAQVTMVDGESGVAHQPLSLEETVEGAMNRAKNVYDNCDYSFGVESGLIKVPHTKTGYMDITICAIFDGKECYLGSSAGFEYPSKIVSMVFDDNIEISDGARMMGLTQKEKVGNEEGMIGILTKLRWTRKTLNQQAITTALIQLENKELYQ